MMPNGMPGQMRQSMQQPQPGNLAQQLPGKIMAGLSANLHKFQGSWQATFDVRDRTNRILQLCVHCRAVALIRIIH